MKLRAFGGDTQTVSDVGLGCWQIGGDQWGEVSDTDAMNTLKAAYDSGVSFFDTADIYGLGRSEELVTKFVQEVKPKNLFIATKLGRWPQPGLPENATAANLRRFTEASLKRLDTDCLDLTQLHCVPDTILAEGGVFQTLRELQAEGKIRRFGASVESTAAAKICLAQPGLASLQIIFNIYRQTPITALFDECKTKGVAIIVRLPLASGMLSGKYNPQTTFAASDHRTYNRNGEKFNVGETFAGVGFETGLELTNELRAILPTDMPMVQAALRWCLDFDAVTTIIPGARNPEQARANALPSDLPRLSDEVHAKLSDFYTNRVAACVRGPD